MVVFIIILFALRMLSGSAQTDLSNQRSIAPECRQLLAHLEAAEMLENMILLNLLRRGETNAAIEALEFEIDTKVVALHTNKNDEVIMSHLRAIREYRSKNPRQKNPMGENEAFESMRQNIMGKAGRILEALEPKQ